MLINQLRAVWEDSLEDSHKNHPLLKKYSTYREYLENEILDKHTTKTFSIKQDEAWSYCELIEKRKK